MKKFIQIVICLSLNFILQTTDFSQAQLPAPPPVPNPSCASCGAQSKGGVINHATNCPYYVAPKKSSGVVVTPANSMNMMIAGTIMQSFLSNLFAPSNSQQDQQKKIAAQQQQQQMLLLQQQQQKKIQDSIDNMKYLKLMGLYKGLDGSQKLDFKNLNGTMEALSANARSQFDGLAIGRDSINIPHATNFFGVWMSPAEVQTLTDPDKDSVIMDINNADKLLKENKMSDSAKVANLKNDTAQKKDIVNKRSDCDLSMLENRLNGYFKQRDNFHKTILSTKNDLDEWKEKNDKAMWEAAYTGLEFAFSQKFEPLLENVLTKGEEAKGIEQRLLPHMDELRMKGVDVDNYLKTLQARIFNADHLAKDVKEFQQAAEYDGFIRDGLQVGFESNKKTDSVFNRMKEDTAVQMILNDGHPIVDAGQFIVSQGLEKLFKTQFLKNLKKFDNKIPYVKYAQLVVDEGYNALDMWLSYQRIKQLHEVEGQESKAVMTLQTNIDKTIQQIKDCK